MAAVVKIFDLFKMEDSTARGPTKCRTERTVLGPGRRSQRYTYFAAEGFTPGLSSSCMLAGEHECGARGSNTKSWKDTAAQRSYGRCSFHSAAGSEGVPRATD